VDGQTVLGDYSIGTGSQAVNAATSSGAPSADFFGTARPQGSGPDIGAVEIVLPPSDLAVTKTDNVTTVARGATGVTYTIVVTNNGPGAASGATLTETLPGSVLGFSRFNVTSWTCSASAGSSCAATGTGNNTRSGTMSLLNGGTATYTLVGDVPTTAPLGSSTNTVTVSGGGDPNTANNTASDTDTIVPPVAFTAESGPASFVLGGTTLNFGNLSGLQSDTITVTVGASVTFGTATVTNMPSSNTNFSKGVDTCSGATLTAGSTCTITINFNAPAGIALRAATLSVPYSGASGSPAMLLLAGS
jgi:uncharacterized repeat protein (TIGR01451 family)